MAQGFESELLFHPSEYEGRTKEFRATIVLSGFQTGMKQIELQLALERAVRGAQVSSWHTQVIVTDQRASVLIQDTYPSLGYRHNYVEFRRKVTAVYDQIVAALG